MIREEETKKLQEQISELQEKLLGKDDTIAEVLNTYWKMSVEELKEITYDLYYYSDKKILDKVKEEYNNRIQEEIEDLKEEIKSL